MNDNTSIIKRTENPLESNRHLRTLSPEVDIYENKDEILVVADMPGMSREQIQVNIDNGRLTLTGSREMNAEGAATWEEFGDVRYHRVFSVPQTIDTAKVNAELRDGVLRLHLPKSEKAKPRQIEIKAA